MDALGNARANPFRFGNITRPKVSSESRRACPCSRRSLALCSPTCKSASTLAGARNFALIPVLPGDRVPQCEVVRMQWKHIRPSKSQRERIIYAWAGKGGKTEDEPLPEIVWNAIVHYLFSTDVGSQRGPARAAHAAGRLHFPCRVPPRHGLSDQRGRLRPGRGDQRQERCAFCARRCAKPASPTGKPCANDLRHTWALRMVADGANDSEVSGGRITAAWRRRRYIGSLKQKSRDRKDVRSGRLAVQLRAFADGDAPGSWEEVIEGA